MITPEIAVAYTKCKLSAYLLMHSNKGISDHEYTEILREKYNRNRENYLREVRKNIRESERFSLDGMKHGVPIMLNASLVCDGMTAFADLIAKEDHISSQRTSIYAPTIVIGTRKIDKEHRLHIAFVGYLLSKLQKQEPRWGKIVTSGDKVHKVALEPFYKEIRSVIEALKKWGKSSSNRQPPLILNKHCTYCTFRKKCEARAVETDDLSLLEGISQKDIQSYHKKGIFSITQLSYLFRPRKQRKGKKHETVALRYRAPLHALAIRTKKIYIQELPEFKRQQVELYLDIEGVPDEDFFYLIGLLVVNGEQKERFSFWADAFTGERQIWNSFIGKVRESEVS